MVEQVQFPATREAGAVSSGRQDAASNLLLKNKANLAPQRTLCETEELLWKIFESTPECVTIVDREGRLLTINPAGRSMLECEHDDAILGGSIYELVAPEFREAFRALNDRVLSGASETLEFQIQGLKGRRRWVETQATPIKDASSSGTLHLGVTRDITVRKRAEALLQCQKNVLERIVAGADVAQTLETLTAALEANALRKTIATIMTVSEDGKALVPVAGLSAPAEWREYIARVPIGPNIGSCGTAAHLRTNVIASDIDSDPRWASFREVALRLGLRACWSTPILSADNVVLGTFAIYYPSPTEPSAEEVEMIEMLARTAAVAIQKAGLYVALQRELSHHKQAEIASRRLAAIVESSDDAIISKDLNGIIQSWNQGAERIFGYKAEEVIGRSITILIPEERLDEETRILASLRAGRRVDHFETIRKRKNGELAAISLTVSPVRDATGVIIGASKIARDVTERKRAEEEQKALYEVVAAVNRPRDLREIYELSMEAIVRSHDPDCVAVFIQKAEGLEPTATRGVSFNAAERGTAEEFQGRLQSMGFQSVQMIPIECEGRMLGAFAVGYKGEHEFNAAQSRAAATVASQVAFAIERRRTGEALEALVNERTASLRSAIEQMEEFSYTVSHDLRAPLRGMEAYGSALIEDFGTELPPEALRYARKITENAHRLDRMILDVLTFSRLARSELQIAPVSLDRLVRDIVDHHPAMQPPAANVQVATLGSVKAHEPSLSQALSNLLANAVKFVPAGVQPIVKIWSERRDRNTRLWVEDNGIGIDPRYQHRLFSMFERIHSNLSYDGTGVGLAIVRKAMDRMGGACGVESDGKNGSRFWIEMPAAD